MRTFPYPVSVSSVTLLECVAMGPSPRLSLKRPAGGVTAELSHGGLFTEDVRLVRNALNSGAPT